MHRDRLLDRDSLAVARATVDTVVAPASRRASARRFPLGVPIITLGADVAALVVSAVLVGHLAEAVVFTIGVLVVRGALHQYRRRMSLSILDDLPRSIGGACGGLALALVFVELTGMDVPSGTLLDRTGIFLAVALVLQAAAYALVRHARRNRRGGGRRTLVIGTGRVGTTLATALHDHPDLGLQPVGFVDPEPTGAVPADTDGVLDTDIRSLPQTIVDNDIDTVILAFRDTGEAYVDTIMSVHQTGCTVMLVPTMFELHHDGPDVERVRGIPVLRLRTDPTLRPSWWIKRSVDVLVGVVALLLLAVPFAIVALAILIDSGRPVLFWQERVGLDGLPFRLCKFRSMRPASESEAASMWNIGRDPRVGRLGRFLRRSSVDELPQLWNIVRGQMSLVGPRPERPLFVRQFSAEHERYWARHRVPVGLTGLAQVSGLRGDTSIRERARYDNYYIANWSLWLDLKIVLRTVREVLGGGGR